MSEQEVNGNGISRRDFVKTSVFLGGAAAVAAPLPWLLNALGGGEPSLARATSEYSLAKPESIIYSVCRLCNVHCPIKVKVRDGVAVKIDGSGYSPQNMTPQLAYATAPAAAATVDGRLCPKGQSAIQYIYDPYRIRKVLKRAGPRGSGKWISVPFDQAIKEIVEGGKLFANVAGEESREVEGLKSLWALRDATVIQKMGDDVKKILAEKDVTKKKALVDKFKTDYAQHLSNMIDPDHPDFGPRNNQFVFEGGRMEPGRQAVLDRAFKNAFGSVNLYHAGGSLCSASVYQARSEMTNEFVEGKWTNGKKEAAVDALNSEFLLAFGINYFEARATAPYAGRITDGLATGRMKIAVVDPRLSKMAAKAWKWLPVKPGADGALAMGMIRWIIENDRFDLRYLLNANKAAANADDEPTVSNATWLVRIDDKGNPGAFLRASEISLAAKEQRPAAAGGEWTFDPFVVQSNGKPVAFDPGDTKNAVQGDLLVNTTVGGVRVKSAFELLKEEAFSKSMDEWAATCGIAAREIAAVAKEFTSHGKKAGTGEYRGVTAHSNGFSAAQAIFSLNLLIGNVGWRGGISAGGGAWDDMGAKKGQPYNLASLHPGKVAAFGLMLTRQGSKYDESTLFTSYPAKRPWIPIPGGAIRHEIYPSMVEGYPYKAKALFTYKANTVTQAPGGQAFINALKDPAVLPLFFACDIVIGETSMYADYIFPDISVWERWGFPGAIPEVPQKLSKVRQPTISPIPETVKVFGEEMPISVEAITLAIAEQLQLPGFGANGLAEGVAFKRPEDFYLKRVANIAFGEAADGTGAVPDATAEELALFAESRRHLSPAVFDLAKWQAAVKPELWKKVVYVLNRGGRFEDFERAWKGNLVATEPGHIIASEEEWHAGVVASEQLTAQPKGVMAFYAENVAKAKNSMTGANFPGIARWQPPADLLGKELPAEDGTFNLISYKEVGVGHSRTMSGYWMLATFPESLVYMNSADAGRLHLEDGDRVKLSSRTVPGTIDVGNGGKIDLVAPVKVVEGIRPGVVALAGGYGHWAWGARDVQVDGETIKGDARRAKGAHPNLVVASDPQVPTAMTVELVAGNIATYDAKVKLTRV
ncbi:MAG: molybdopterin-dependent oxidoreductase [Chloroflexi bacterium]|nr:molybdopterin-dependent oxidoreductase [Chloroflexota bacterium]